MAQDYVVLNDKGDNGMIAVNKNVFKSIAEMSIDEVENAERISGGRFAKSVVISLEGDTLKVEAYIKVRYGANVSATCELVQNKIYENLTFMTGIKPADVSVNVIDFKN